MKKMIRGLCGAFLALAAAVAQAAFVTLPTPTFDEASRSLTLPTIELGGWKYSNVVVKVNDFSVRANAFTSQPYPQLTGIDLVLPTVKVGETTHRDLVVTLNHFEVLSVGAAEPVEVTGNCDSRSFTKARYDAVYVGMTYGEVIRLFGCYPHPQLTSKNYSWMLHRWSTEDAYGGALMGIYFDTNGERVVEIAPQIYKWNMGIGTTTPLQ